MQILSFCKPPPHFGESPNDMGVIFWYFRGHFELKFSKHFYFVTLSLFSDNGEILEKNIFFDFDHFCLYLAITPNFNTP